VTITSYATTCPDCKNGYRLDGQECETCLGTPGKIILPEPKAKRDPYRVSGAVIFWACVVAFIVILGLIMFGSL
jgi:hypothetical protein